MVLAILLGLAAVFGVGAAAGKDGHVGQGAIKNEVRAWKAEMTEFELQQARFMADFQAKKIAALEAQVEAK
jgi:hypothetical protein